MGATTGGSSGSAEEETGDDVAPGVEWRPVGQGIEAARLPGGGALVRGRGDPDGPVLRFTRAEMEAFARGARDGEFDDLAAGAHGPGGASESGASQGCTSRGGDGGDAEH